MDFTNIQINTHTTIQQMTSTWPMGL